jgi:hypothetical protein
MTFGVKGRTSSGASVSGRRTYIQAPTITAITAMKTKIQCQSPNSMIT